LFHTTLANTASKSRVAADSQLLTRLQAIYPLDDTVRPFQDLSEATLILTHVFHDALDP